MKQLFGRFGLAAVHLEVATSKLIGHNAFINLF